MTSDLTTVAVDKVDANGGERGIVHYGDNLPILRSMAPQSVDLIYTDPPFNTGKKQARTQLRTIRDPTGDRTGFQGRRYRSIKVATREFEDDFDDYLAFLKPRLEEAHRVLSLSGSLYLHLDYREVHYAKIMLDGIFGRECFLNEVIWLTTTAAALSENGRLSMTTFWSMFAILNGISSTLKRWNASLTWRLDWSDLKRQHVESSPQILGGTRLFLRMGENARDIPRKSRSASCAE